MKKTQVKEKSVTILKTEYLRLKNLDKKFGEFLKYFEHLKDVREAREEIKKGKGMPQEEVFKELGL